MIKLKETNPINQFLFCSILILLHIDCNAQEQEKEVIKQNKFVVGLSAYFDSFDEYSEDYMNEIINEKEYTYFNFNPYVGWRPNDKWLLGVHAVFFKQKNIEMPDPDPYDVKFNGYNFGIFGRYEKKLCKDLNLYLWNFLNYISSESNSSNTAVSIITNYNGIMIGFSPGLIYSLNKRINFSLGLGQVRYMLTKREENRYALDSILFESDESIIQSKNKRHTFSTELNFARPVLSIEIKI